MKSSYDKFEGNSIETVNDSKISRMQYAVASAMTAAWCALVTSCPAFANASAISSGIQKGTGEVWNILKAIVLPIAAIMLAVCGVKLIWGGQRAAEEAKGLIVKIIVGVGLVMIAPSLVAATKDWFGSASWSF